MPASAVIETVSQVPFVSHSGIDLVATGTGWAIAALDQAERHTSHSGALQGAAIYSVAEAAASLIVAGVFETQQPGMTYAIFESSISFRRPAQGRLVANAALAESMDRVRARLHRDGAVSFAVIARLSDANGDDVGRAEFGCRIVLPAAPEAAQTIPHKGVLIA
ncbi:MAG: PaaI family thioesterase [Dehalococcoidia bacterium]